MWDLTIKNGGLSIDLAIKSGDLAMTIIEKWWFQNQTGDFHEHFIVAHNRTIPNHHLKNISGLQAII